MVNGPDINFPTGAYFIRSPDNLFSSRYVYVYVTRDDTIVNQTSKTYSYNLKQKKKKNSPAKHRRLLEDDMKIVFAAYFSISVMNGTFKAAPSFSTHLQQAQHTHIRISTRINYRNGRLPTWVKVYEYTSI